MSSLFRGSMTKSADNEIVLVEPANKLEHTSSLSSTLTPDLSHSDSDESTELEVEISPIEIVYSGEPGTIEPVTGFAYPNGLNQYRFVGCGVRTKYIVIHAYAVGVYIDVESSVLRNVKTDEVIQDLLTNPNHSKVFRLVMNRNVTSSQYIGAIYDALTPLMRGQDMDKLEEMKRQDMPTTLDKGTEIFLIVEGNKLTMQVGTDRAGKIESLVLTSAVCENYLGDKPVSPAMKKAVMSEMEKLQCANNMK